MHAYEYNSAIRLLQDDSFCSERSDLGALGISLIVHLLFFALWISFDARTDEITTKTVKVNLVKEKTEEQIVSPSNIEETKEEVITSKLSDKNTTVKKEMIKRGVTLSSSKPISPEKTGKKQKPAIESSKGSIDKSDKKQQHAILSLTPSQIARQMQKQQKSTPIPNQDLTKLRTQQDYSPFRRSLQTSVSGRLGSPDYLPTIQDGEITLLNAKADHYAVFVRRVAIQVFGILRRMSWSTLSRNQIYQLRQYTEVRATLNAKGELLKVELGGSSGVSEFDNLLRNAAKEGAWDKNPPKGAQTVSGNIVFVFRSKTWSRPGPDGIGENRWLLLSTGLL